MTAFYSSPSNSRAFLPEILSCSDYYLYSYGRLAFYDLLKSLEIESVYIPGFLCRDMLAPIKKLEISYKYYDVNSKLEAELEPIKADAVVAVNYFGFPQNLTPFKTYCRKYGAILIEDNAHGFLSRDASGQLLGTRGDIGLFSFRKTILLPNGSGLVINNPSLKRIPFSSGEIGYSKDDKKYYKKLKLVTWIQATSSKIGVALLLFRRYWRYLRTGNSLPMADGDSENELPSNNRISPILAENHLPLNLQKEIRRRHQMYMELLEYAEKFSIQPLFSDLNINTVPYAFPFIAEAQEAREFEKYLLYRNFFILPWPDLPGEIYGVCNDFYKRIWMVPFLW